MPPATAALHTLPTSFSPPLITILRISVTEPGEMAEAVEQTVTLSPGAAGGTDD